MAWTTTVTIGGTDYTDETLQGVTMQYGRQSAGSDPQPTTCSLQLVREALGVIPFDDLSIGDKVVVKVTPTGEATATRFVGLVTDFQITTRLITVNAVAAGLYLMARATSQITNTWNVDTGQPYRLTIAVRNPQLVLNWLGDTGGIFSTTLPYFTTYATTTIGGEQFADYQDAGSVDGLNVLNVARSYLAAAKGNAAIWERFVTGTKGGTIATSDYVELIVSTYEDRDDVSTADVTLTADETGFDWQGRSDTSLLNGKVVEDYAYYNSGGALQASATVVATNPRQDAYTGVVTSLQNRMRYQTDAQVAAQWKADVGYNPGPMVAIPIPFGALTPARMTTLFANMTGSKLWFTPALADGLPTKWFLEGYTERIGRTGYDVTVQLSHFGNSWLGQQWGQVTNTLQWGQVDASYNWTDLQMVEL
jgi:hypothetical protein